MGSAFAAGKLSRALHLGKAGVTAFPDDAGLRYRYGAVLSKVLELDEARKHLEIARRTLDKDPELMVELGWIYWTQGEVKKAEALAAEAYKLASDNPRVAEFRFNLEVQARIKTKQPLALETGSAPAYVSKFLARIERGDLTGAIDEHVEREALDRIVRGTGGDPAVGRKRVLRGFTGGLREAWKQFFGKRGNRYEGFDVQPKPEVKGGEHHVVVNILMRRSLDAKQVAQTKRFAADPKFARYIDAETLAIIRGLDPGDRERFFERIVGKTTSIFVGIDVVAVEHPAGGWRIRDVLIGDPPVAFSKLPGIYREAADKGLVPKTRSRKKKNLPYRIGYLVGLILAGFGVLLILRRLSR